MAKLSDLQPTGQNRRRTPAARQKLRLAGALVNLESSNGGPPAAATIMNISPTGVLLETDFPATMDQLLHVDLGAAGRHEIRVRWVDGLLLGCQFSEVLPKSRISAALLQGERREQAVPGEAGIASPAKNKVSARRDFGLAVAWARNAKGVNQAELAQAIGVSTTTICKWERGHATPRAAALARLQEFLPDVQTFVTQPTRHQAQASRAVDGDIPGIISECRARLSDHLGLDIGAIDIQITISGLARTKLKRRRR